MRIFLCLQSSDTLSYSIDTVNVVGFYRDNVKVRSRQQYENNFPQNNSVNKRQKKGKRG